MGDGASASGCRCATCAAILIPFTLAGGLGFWLQRKCLSELGSILIAEVFLILFWMCFRRPLISFTYLYLLACFVLLVRETVLTCNGRLPCGLHTFGVACMERKCAEYNHIPILMIETSCARYECTREVEVEESEVFTSHDSFTKWSVSALVSVWIAFAISARQLRRWRARARSLPPCNTSGPTDSKGREMEYVSVILVVPVTYGLCALHALRVLSVNREDTWQAEGMMSAAELYSALSLFAFQRLLQIYVKSCGSKVWDAGEVPLEEASAKRDCPECEHNLEMLQQQTNVRGHFQELVAAGLKQYVVLVFGCNALEMLAKTWNWLYPSYCRTALSLVASMWFPHHEISLTVNATVIHQKRHHHSSSLACEDLWNTVSLLMVVANMFTCSIALYAVLQYERTFSKLLKPKSPFWKFWGVKGMLSVNFLQRLVLMGMGLVWQDAKMSHDFRTFLNFYLVCVEVTALALLNVFAYACSVPGGAESESLGLTSIGAAASEKEHELTEIVGNKAED